MQHLILVSIGLITAVHTKTALESCFDAVKPVRILLGLTPLRICFPNKKVSDCCEMEVSEANTAILKECRKTFPNNNTCDFQTCYAGKKGFLFSNGTVDKIALKQILEADFGKYSNILPLLKQKCLNVNFNENGLPESCHLKKFANCVGFFFLANCPKWSNEQRCRKVKLETEECAKLLT